MWRREGSIRLEKRRWREERRGTTRQFEFHLSPGKEKKTHEDLGQSRRREEVIQSESRDEVGLLMEER